MCESICELNESGMGQHSWSMAHNLRQARVTKVCSLLRSFGRQAGRQAGRRLPGETSPCHSKAIHWELLEVTVTFLEMIQCNVVRFSSVTVKI